MRRNELGLLLRMFDEAYQKKTWHGPNLQGSLRGLSSEEAKWRPDPHRHTIWEIVVHCAYWKYTVRRRLLGEKRGSFPLKGSNWFALPLELNSDMWKRDLRLLETVHRSLRAAIADIPQSQLHKKSSGGKYANSAIIFGIANHDIYHAGQIQLLKRLMQA